MLPMYQAVRAVEAERVRNYHRWYYRPSPAAERVRSVR